MLYLLERIDRKGLSKKLLRVILTLDNIMGKALALTEKKDRKTNIAHN